MADLHLLFLHRGVRYALDAALVQEIVWLPELSPVAEVLPCVIGAFNLRGHVISVIDLAPAGRPTRVDLREYGVSEPSAAQHAGPAARSKPRTGGLEPHPRSGLCGVARDAVALGPRGKDGVARRTGGWGRARDQQPAGVRPESSRDRDAGARANRGRGGGLERIRDLVVKLHTFSRLDAGEISTIDVEEAIESVLTLLRPRLRERIRVTRRFGAQCSLDCYPGPFNQVLMNLLANAVDATDAAVRDGEIFISIFEDDDMIRIEIADNGKGMPDAVRERIFEPFFTTTAVGEGTGLGLSIPSASSVCRCG